MSGYCYECHGDIFDAWDDHVAAQQGYKPLPLARIADAEDDRQRNIRSMHDFNRSVAALEDARYAAQMRRM